MSANVQRFIALSSRLPFKNPDQQYAEGSRLHHELSRSSSCGMSELPHLICRWDSGKLKVVI